MKTSTKRKAISKKVIGNTNTASGSVDIVISKQASRYGIGGTATEDIIWDNAIDVPIHLRGGEFHWNFDKKPMQLVDKITWVLTAVNVAILISLFIKNI